MCILKLWILDVHSQSWGLKGGKLDQVKGSRCAFSELGWLAVNWVQVKVSIYVFCLFSKLARRIADVLGNGHLDFLIEPSESVFFP